MFSIVEPLHHKFFCVNQNLKFPKFSIRFWFSMRFRNWRKSYDANITLQHSVQTYPQTLWISDQWFLHLRCKWEEMKHSLKSGKFQFDLTNARKLIKGRHPKKKRDFLGIFPKFRPPPLSPPFGNPCFQKKKYRLFCILGPLEHIWSSSKCSLFGNYSDINFWE